MVRIQVRRIKKTQVVLFSEFNLRKQEINEQIKNEKRF